MRLTQCIQEKHIRLSELEFLVLDEADKLLQEGFLEQTDEILAACSTSRQTFMFSATMSSTLEALAKTVMKSDAVRIIVGQKYEHAQHFRH